MNLLDAEAPLRLPPSTWARALGIYDQIDWDRAYADDAVVEFTDRSDGTRRCFVYGIEVD
jgi:hypothetical protein